MPSKLNIGAYTILEFILHWYEIDKENYSIFDIHFLEYYNHWGEHKCSPHIF